MQRIQPWFLVFLTLAILFANLFSGSVSGVLAQAGTHFVRVPFVFNASLTDLDLQPLVRLDYETFTWLELNRDDFNTLQASDVSYDEQAGAGVIQIMGYSFDPIVQGEPSLDPEMRMSDDETGFYLVQFLGPLRQEWLDGLARAGIQILQYIPSHTLLVWGNLNIGGQVGGLPAVRWRGAFHPAYRLQPGLTSWQGVIENVAITFIDNGQVQETVNRIIQLGGQYIQHFPAQPDGRFWTAIFTLDASRLEDIARLSPVWAVEYLSPRPAFDDENGAQIVAGNYSSGMPVTGYYDWLATKGVDGGGITWADVDTGLNGGHPDITGRVAAYITYEGAGAANVDTDGHGSHTAGAIFGDGRAASGGTGLVDGSGFYYGTGAAPAAAMVVQNALMGTAWPPIGGWQRLSKDTVTNGAIGSNNSWYTGATGAQGYSSAARTHDMMVRDANFDTPGVAEPIILVFSAGNSGPSTTTITEPKEAKNMIVVGSSANYPRAGASLNDLADYSSRGPAKDGRLLPNVIAPGWNTISFNGSTNTCGTKVSGSAGNYYNYCSGTSMAAPFVSGTAALIADWWDQEGWGTPSPAMVKALLINGAVDMVGGSNGAGGSLANIPNNNQGWGRVNLNNIIRTGRETMFRDQVDWFDDTGEAFTYDVSIADPSQPVKITLVWSDAPGAIGAIPALVNNLDLTVSSGGITYRGNVFSGGWSASGGSPDSLNNIENVYIQSPGTTASITIQAANVAGDGIPFSGDATDQDFALVCSNCLYEDFTLQVAPDRQSICAGPDVIYDLNLGQMGGFNDPVSLTASDLPAGVTAIFAPQPFIPPTIGTMTIDNTQAATGGNYRVTVTGTSATRTHRDKVYLGLYSSAPGSPALQSPPDGAVSLPAQVTLSWLGGTQSDAYTVEIANDPSFSQIVYQVDTTATSLVTPALSYGTNYYWRVKATNPCGDVFSPARSFAIEPRFSICRSPNLSIPDGNTTGVSDTISNPDVGTALDLDVKIVATHTYIGDLIFKLQHVGVGSTVALIDRPGYPTSTYGCSSNHINAVLDDAAAAPVENQCASSSATAPPPYAIDGVYYPNNPLSTFNQQSWAGDWKLTVSDSYTPDSGKLTEWCLLGVNSADYSDLSGSYGTAFHTGDGSLHLGAAWTSETTLGEGSDDPSDDGVTRTSAWVSGGQAALDVQASGAGWLAAWVDWNGNGYFESAEKVIDRAAAAGNNELSVDVPASYITGTTVRARFRLYPSQPAERLTTGSVRSGEVEDYIWTFSPTVVRLTSLNVSSYPVSIPLPALGLLLLALVSGLMVWKRKG